MKREILWTGSGLGPAGDSLEVGNESVGSVMGGEFLDQPRVYCI